MFSSPTASVFSLPALAGHYTLSSSEPANTISRVSRVIFRAIRQFLTFDSTDQIIAGQGDIRLYNLD